MKIFWKRLAILSLPVTAVVWLIGFLMTKLQLGTVKGLFASIPATSAITSTMGSKAYALIGGLVPNAPTIPIILLLLISVFLTLVIGNLVAELLFKGKTLKNFIGLGPIGGMIATYIILGALVGYLLFVGLKLPTRLTLIGTAIHTFLVALGSAFLVKVSKIKI